MRIYLVDHNLIICINYSNTWESSSR